MLPPKMLEAVGACNREPLLPGVQLLLLLHLAAAAAGVEGMMKVEPCSNQTCTLICCQSLFV
jgi:hypothetical protein